MARSISSQKRQRQNTKRAAINTARRTLIKSRIRKVRDALTAKDAGAAREAMREAVKVLDRNADRGTVHPNTAARRKSRLAKRINALSADQATR